VSKHAIARLKRVQTDPDVSVLLDALLEGDESRASAVAAQTGGRVCFEQLEPKYTAVAWGMRYREVPLAYFDVVREDEQSGERNTRFELLPTRAERSGTISHFDIYGPDGELVYEHRRSKFTGWELRAGDDIGIALVHVTRRELLRTGVENAYRRGYGNNVDLRPSTILGSLVEVMVERLLEAEQQLQSSIDRLSIDKCSSDDLDQMHALTFHATKAGTIHRTFVEGSVNV
jgi:hypothetical protein